MAMKKYRDEGYGQTDLSKKWVEKWIDKGLISKRNIKSIILSGIKGDYLVQVQTKDGLFDLSGFSWGYLGTGPHGLLWLFEILKIPFNIEDIGSWKQSGLYRISKKKGKWEVSDIE